MVLTRLKRLARGASQQRGKVPQRATGIYSRKARVITGQCIGLQAKMLKEERKGESGRGRYCVSSQFFEKYFKAFMCGQEVALLSTPISFSFFKNQNHELWLLLLFVQVTRGLCGFYNLCFTSLNFKIKILQFFRHLSQFFSSLYDCVLSKYHIKQHFSFLYVMVGQK